MYYNAYHKNDGLSDHSKGKIKDFLVKYLIFNVWLFKIAAYNP